MSDDSTTAALRRALADAVKEIEEHNAEYGHKTPSAKLNDWRQLASDAQATSTLHEPSGEQAS